MINNDKLQLAWDFVNHTDRNIFLTGKAGTGKTTFLHKLKDKSMKRMVIVAPTGVAAINAKGVTIHSFFQLPFGPIIPGHDATNSSSTKKFSRIKINIIKSLDLLIIDEISMVRADVLDGIDYVLRRFRNKNKPFGGIQLLLIGDLQQLSPVIKPEDWQLLKNYYSTGYFFGSKAFVECNAIAIELTHIFRQESEHFIKILNEIRANNLSKLSKEELNKRYKPDFSFTAKEGYITLTTHNYRADNINSRELNNLEGKTFIYKSKVEGKFPEYMYPTHSTLEFKVGAQVMFIKNDSSPEKRFYNGKIGRITYLDKKEIKVHCQGEDTDITTSPETWENINYSIDPETKSITENKLGEFIQMPLRLAWAITIHKSQGLTFDNIIVDAEDAFAHGQTYVALSRCKTLGGIVLTTPITEKSIINNHEIESFNETSKKNQPDENTLKDSQRIFQLNLIEELFNYYSFLHPINRIIDIYYKNAGALQGNLLEKINEIKANGITELLKISTKFQAQVNDIVKATLPESNSLFQDRFKKAVCYYENHSVQFIKKVLDKLEFSSDNQTVLADIDKHIGRIEVLLSIKLLCFKQLKSGFNVSEYLNIRAKATLQEEESSKSRKREIVNSTEHPILFEELRSLRTVLAHADDVPPYQVFTQKSLYEMCEFLPRTSKELRVIKDIGKLRLEKYGEEILRVINEYCETNDIVAKEPVIKPRANSSAQTSYELFKSGKNMSEIAKERNLTIGTIEGHLIKYLITGEVKITDLMSEEKYTELKSLMESLSYEGFSDLKSKIDEKFSFNEIRMVAQVLHNEGASTAN